MATEVVFTDEFEAWYGQLSEAEQDGVCPQVYRGVFKE